MLKHIKIIFLVLLICFSKISRSQCVFPNFSSGTYNCLTNQAVGEYTINGAAFPQTITVVNAITTATLYTVVITVNTGTLPPIPVGNYSVFGVTSTPNCTFLVSPFTVVASVSSANLTFSTLASCPGTVTGAATVFIANGTNFPPPYTYTWNTGSNSTTISPVSPGVYTVSVANSTCVLTNTVQVVSAATFTSNLSTNTIACFGGTINSAIVTNGTNTPFTYTVNGSAIPGTTVGPLSAGVVTIITKDAGQCKLTNTVNVTQPIPPAISFSITQPSCPQSTNGAVAANVTGAPPSVSYTWSPLGVFTQNINQISMGTYTLTIKDGSACITKSVVIVTPQSAMNLTSSATSENCSAMDGAFTLNITGGGTPYTYSTISIGTHTNNVLTGLSSGVYTTIVTDNGGCKDTVKTVVGNLSTVSLSIVNSNSIQCYSQCTGSLQLNVINGIAPFSFSATGVPTTTSTIITGLCAGNILIKVLDANGCPATKTVNFASPPVFSFSAANPPNACSGTTFALSGNASGGSAPYNFIWQPGNLNGQTVVATAAANTIYSLNVFDSNNCTLAPFLVTVNVNAPLSINLNFSSSGICPGTTAQITPTVAGGDGNYSFNWQPGNFNSNSLFVANANIPEYTLTVSDLCGSAPAVKVVTINILPLINPTYSVTLNSGCEPLCTQFINTTVKSSSVTWNYGDKPYEQTGGVTNYCYDRAGVFSIKLSLVDSNNCKTAAIYNNIITVLAKPRVQFVTDPGVITMSDPSNVIIKNATVGGKTFSWTALGEDLGNNSSIIYSFSDTGCVAFRLVAMNDDGCIDSLTKDVCVIDGFNFWMPGSFTPNNDGINDVFYPVGTGFVEDEYLFEVYNRWGNRIFRTRELAGTWDGKTKGTFDELGQYMWYVTVKDNQGVVHHLKGFVDVMR